jgi:phenylpropionate dioxygenase-like ring-hydroxylating dioxygenase large terminal subunit
MAESDSPIGRAARNPGLTWDDMARMDSRPVPDFLLGDACPYLGSDPLSVDRYVSADFFAREVEKMWPNVWQFAAREEDLIEPGSSIVFDNVGRSYVLIRQDDGSVRAFHNVCLHRGRRLRDLGGMVRELRCPFHAFTWNLDGSLKSIPCRWDFPQIDDEAMHLPEAEVGHWGGYIFIRENPGGPSLEDYLAPLPDQFSRWRHEDCYTASWNAKIVPANWKACAEAFMEAFHVIATHPQIMPFTGDANSKYFVWGDNVSLLLTPFGVPSPHVAHVEREPQWVIDQFLKNNSRVAPQGVEIRAQPGKTVRETMGDFNRKRFSAASERDLDFASDSEMVDAFTYNVFPNFSPWGGFAPNIVYRWRPWPDQDHTLMEVRILNRLKPGQPLPPAPPMNLIPQDGTWAEQLGTLGAILDQDMANLPSIQQGMRNSKTGQLQLGNYQEIKVRHLHRTLDKYLDAR